MGLAFFFNLFLLSKSAVRVLRRLWNFRTSVTETAFRSIWLG